MDKVETRSQPQEHVGQAALSRGVTCRFPSENFPRTDLPMAYPELRRLELLGAPVSGTLPGGAWPIGQRSMHDAGFAVLHRTRDEARDDSVTPLFHLAS